MLHLVSGVNSLLLSVSLTSVSLCLTRLFLLLPYLLLLTYHSHHQQLPHSFTLGSRSTSFTNLSHHRLSSGLRTDFVTGLFVLSNSFLCLVRVISFSVLVHGQVTIIFVVSVCLSVCLSVCAEFFSAVFDPISIRLGHMLCVWV